MTATSNESTTEQEDWLPSFPQPTSVTQVSGLWRITVEPKSIAGTTYESDWANASDKKSAACFLRVDFNSAMPADTVVSIFNDANVKVNQMVAVAGQTVFHLPVPFPGTQHYDLQFVHSREQTFPAVKQVGGGLVIVADLTGEDDWVAPIDWVSHQAVEEPQQLRSDDLRR